MRSVLWIEYPSNTFILTLIAEKVNSVSGHFTASLCWLFAQYRFTRCIQKTCGNGRSALNGYLAMIFAVCRQDIFQITAQETVFLLLEQQVAVIMLKCFFFTVR